MTRELLPNRRLSETIRFAVERRDRSPQTYFATVGYYDDGRIGEVFLSTGKAGSDVDIATRDAAIAFSFALQHGCSLDAARAAFCRDETGGAEGPLGALLDLLASERRAPEPVEPPPAPAAMAEKVAL